MRRAAWNSRSFGTSAGSPAARRWELVSSSTAFSSAETTKPFAACSWARATDETAASKVAIPMRITIDPSMVTGEVETMGVEGHRVAATRRR